jgi:hypothetical protein
MKKSFGLACLCICVASNAWAVDYSIGKFAGGVPETGWGKFSGGVQPLDATVYTVTDLDTSGDGGALETNIPNFSDSFAYSFTTAGTVAQFFNHRKLTFDLIYRGTATDVSQGGFDQVYQVLFQSNFNSFAFTAYQNNENGIPLSQFGGGGSSAGFGPGNQPPATVLSVTIDYSSFLNTLPNGFNPSTLQFWMSTNDSNRRFKAIDNVRLSGEVPEPTSAALLLTAMGLFGLIRRR